MVRIYLAVKALLRGDEGHTLVEYALLLAFMALAALAGIALLGSQISSFFQSVSGSI
jgi:pilus assembly protein Flp/PilA